MLVSVAVLKAALNVPDDAEDADLFTLSEAAEAALGALYALPTVPKATETRVVFADGGLVHLSEEADVTAITDLQDNALAFVTIPGGFILHDPHVGHIKVTAEWGYDATPPDVREAIVQTVTTWRSRRTRGEDNAYIGRLDAIPQSAHDLMRARRLVM